MKPSSFWCVLHSASQSLWSDGAGWDWTAGDLESGRQPSSDRFTLWTIIASTWFVSAHKILCQGPEKLSRIARLSELRFRFHFRHHLKTSDWRRVPIRPVNLVRTWLQRRILQTALMKYKVSHIKDDGIQSFLLPLLLLLLSSVCKFKWMLLVFHF